MEKTMTVQAKLPFPVGNREAKSSADAGREGVSFENLLHRKAKTPGREDEGKTAGKPSGEENPGESGDGSQADRVPEENGISLAAGFQAAGFQPVGFQAAGMYPGAGLLGEQLAEGEAAAEDLPGGGAAALWEGELPLPEADGSRGVFEKTGFGPLSGGELPASGEADRGGAQAGSPDGSMPSADMAAGPFSPETGLRGEGISLSSGLSPGNGEGDGRPEEASDGIHRTDSSPQAAGQKGQEAAGALFAGQAAAAGGQRPGEGGASPSVGAQTVYGSSQSLSVPEGRLFDELGKALPSLLTGRPQTIEIALEPASLGRLVIRASYEGGRASISILASDPKTLEMLNQRAADLAGILETRTGQETVVYTQGFYEEDSGQAFYKEQGGRRQEEREKRQKRQTSDAFAQQLRLGLV